MIGRVASGYLLDRFYAPRVAMSIFGAVSLGIVLLRAAAGTPLVFLAVFLIGLGMGAEVDIIALLDQPLLRSPCVWGDLWVRLCLIYFGRCTRSVAHGARVRSLRYLWLNPGGFLFRYFVSYGIDDPPRSVSISSWIKQIYTARFPWKGP
jgi:hypothetical protein